MTTLERMPAPSDRLALLALAIGSFGIGTSEFSSMGTLQLFAADLAIDIPAATHAITAYALGVVVGAPLVTLAAARLNRRTVLFLLMGLFVVGNLLSAMAQGVGMLVAARFVSGLPQGGYFGAGAVVATYIVGKDRGGKAFALVVSGLTIATIIGSPIGTFIGQAFGWRTAYLAIAAYGVLALTALALWLPRSRALDGQPVIQELSALARWNVWAMMIVAALAVSSIFAVYTFIGPFVTDVAVLDPGMIPLGLALFGVGMTTGNIVGGHLADMYRFRGLIMGFGATLAVLAVLGLYGHVPVVLMASLFGVGFTTMVAIPTIPVRLTLMAPDAPTMMGAMNMASLNVANAIGAAAGGATIGAGLGLLSAVWAGFALTVLGLSFFVVTFARSRANEPYRRSAPAAAQESASS